MAESKTITVPCPNVKDIGNKKMGLILFLIESIPKIGNTISKENAKKIIQIFVMASANPSTKDSKLLKLGSFSVAKMIVTRKAENTPTKNRRVGFSIFSI